MFPPQELLKKVIGRYLSESENKAFLAELGRYKKVTSPVFVKIMKKHFDIERWRLSPIIWQDIWLYNFFTFEFKGRLVNGGLLGDYNYYVFIYHDREFFKKVEELNRMKPPSLWGAQFIPDSEDKAKSANHLLTENIAPGPPEPQKR